MFCRGRYKNSGDWLIDWLIDVLTWTVVEISHGASRVTRRHVSTASRWNSAGARFGLHYIERFCSLFYKFTRVVDDLILAYVTPETWAFGSLCCNNWRVSKKTFPLFRFFLNPVIINLKLFSPCTCSSSVICSGSSWQLMCGYGKDFKATNIMLSLGFICQNSAGVLHHGVSIRAEKTEIGNWWLTLRKVYNN